MVTLFLSVRERVLSSALFKFKECTFEKFLTQINSACHPPVFRGRLSSPRIRNLLPRVRASGIEEVGRCGLVIISPA